MTSTLSSLASRSPSVCRFAAAVVCAAFSLLWFPAVASEGGVKPLRVDGAPFPLVVGEWTPPGREFPIGAYGARPSASDVSAAIARAVDACAAAGGGRVRVPRGHWRSGPVSLRSGVALWLDRGAVLEFPDRPGEGVDAEAMVLAVDCTNVAVMGEGYLKAEGGEWSREHVRRFKTNGRGFRRPQFLKFRDCRNVRVEGVRLRGSPAWTMHILCCDDVVVRNVESVCTGHNNDGLDIDSCSRVLVEGCSLDQTDDTYTIKSGMNHQGRQRNRSCRDVVIRRCRAKNGHALLGIGSEVSGGVRNVYMTDCEVEGTVWRFVYLKTNDQRGGFIENVLAENIRGSRATSAVFEVEAGYDANPVKELARRNRPVHLTRIANITCRNVFCREARSETRLRGDPRLPMENVVAENIQVGRIIPWPETVVAPEGDSERGDDLLDLSLAAGHRRILSARGLWRFPRGWGSRRVMDDRERDLLSRIANEVCDSLATQADSDGGDVMSLSVHPDALRGNLKVRVQNVGQTRLEDVRGCAYLPPDRLTRVKRFAFGGLAPGESREAEIPVGAGDHTLLMTDSSLVAACADAVVGGRRARTWAEGEWPAPRTGLLPRDVSVWAAAPTARRIPPQDLAAFSVPGARLPDGDWQVGTSPESAWHTAAPGGKRAALAALDFVLPEGGEAKLRSNVAIRSGRSEVYLNGERLEWKGPMSVLPAVVGKNRIVVKSVPDAGRDEPIRLAVYSWAPGGALECLPNRDTDLLAGALDDASRWRTADGAFCRRIVGGLVFASDVKGNRFVEYEVPVPAAWRGSPVRLEVDCRNLAELVVSGMIRLRQIDAEGREIPDPAVDPRSASHMRPPFKPVSYRVPGRLHPNAAALRLCIELRNPEVKFDPYGMPRTGNLLVNPRLEVTRLRLLKAPVAALPERERVFFTHGVGGEAGDMALKLGGEAGAAFFYATRGPGAWLEGHQYRSEDEIFFPSGDGTVEAWFKPSAWSDRETFLFEGSRTFVPNSSPTRRWGSQLWVKYEHGRRKLHFFLRDVAGHEFGGGCDVELPTGKWFHLALQWAHGKSVDLYLDGRRVAGSSAEAFTPLDLQNEKFPNDAHVTECFIGCDSLNGEMLEVGRPVQPVFDGAVDLWRVSSGARYAGPFRPARRMSADARTRALFTFDLSTDGTSGGGAKWISGSLNVPPERPVASADPAKAFARCNYPDIPTVEDFASARRPFRERRDVRPGEAFSFAAPERVFPDYVEIANTGADTLRNPVLLGDGEIDPRSFGDIADSLGLDGLSDRRRADGVFQFVMHASDYFMNHSTYFSPGSDVPGNAEMLALFTLNGYCGFECGPLNSLVANLFACSAGCPSALTRGYAHTFEQVYYEGANRLYDMSALRFYARPDGAGVVSLEDAERRPGVFRGSGIEASYYIRKGTRSSAVPDPSYMAKIGIELRPGERFRAWFDNNGEVNDLQSQRFTVELDKAREPKERYDRQCHATPQWQGSAWRMNRFFPHYGNGYIVYDGPCDGSFEVKSCYPIVAGRYVAKLKDGSCAAISISTDQGKTWRILPDRLLRYEVRARLGYLLRVEAEPSRVASLHAVTEVQHNARVFPGRVRGGVNRMRFRADGGSSAAVTVAGRANGKKMVIDGGVYSGTIPGSERQLAVVDPDAVAKFKVTGASDRARVRAHGGIVASLKGGVLSVSGGTLRKGFAAVDVIDGGDVKQLTVLVAGGARLVASDGMSVSGSAAFAEAGHDRIQRCAVFTDSRSEVRAGFPQLPAGWYAILVLDRFESHPDGDISAPRVDIAVPGVPGFRGCCFAANTSCNFKRANYGVPGGRANFKWDYPRDPRYPYYMTMLCKYDVPAGFDHVDLRGRGAMPSGVELAAVLIVPDLDEELYCDLVKVLCGLNCQPWRVTPQEYNP